MNDLVKQKCEACRVDAPRVTVEELSKFLKEIPQWQTVKEDSELRLKRIFKFNDYVSAVKFSNQVAELAELEDHHPAILLEWGKVEVVWWTHKIGGLHKNDFISAAKTDLIFQ
ncbi:MAG: 4a-hydroxytetrahydrobiopterin dehydratase [SAR86 cluster bacterium]|nr:4a-hydroxytetrahydrobiopterin dehydratase [SAR86 cluster bacterium]